MSSSPVPAHGALRSLSLIQAGDGPRLLLSGAYFFLLLFSFYLLRPVREALGIAGGAEKLPWLMTGTLLGMFLANPLFAALVSKKPRRRFIPILHHFFALNMLVFLGLAHFLPGHGGKSLGYAFYIWLSIFNLFVVSLFWGLMGDLFSELEAKRLFGLVAVGGTLGAICGSAVTGVLTSPHSSWHIQPFLLLIPAVLALELATYCMLRLVRTSAGTVSEAAREPGPGLLAGLWQIGKSPRLQFICLYMLCFSITSTFLYVEQGQIVAATFHDAKSRTAAFAQIDIWVNALTLLTQLFFTGRAVLRFGVPLLLLLLPALSLAGFTALSASASFGVLALYQIARRGLHYAVDRPVREMLFVSVNPDAKYKSKPFIDTFVYRGGDFVGAWLPTWLTAFALPIAPVAIGLSAAWLVVGRALGRSTIERPSFTSDGKS